jgi:protein TonB
MTSRAGLAISLLAACAIHAVVLLVPHIAMSAETPMPVVELDLSAALGSPEGPPLGIPVNAPRAAAGKKVKTQPQPEKTMPPEASHPSTPLEPPAEKALIAQPDETSPTSQETAGPTAPMDSNSGSSDAKGDSTTEGPFIAPSEGEGGGSGPTAVSPTGFLPPRPLTEILPIYPLNARRLGFEGLVRVAAIVDTSGTVTSAEVVASSGHFSLDQAVLESVRRTHFLPATQDGKPESCRILVPRRFSLHEH